MLRLVTARLDRFQPLSSVDLNGWNRIYLELVQTSCPSMHLIFIQSIQKLQCREITTIQHYETKLIVYALEEQVDMSITSNRIGCCEHKLYTFVTIALQL